MCNLKRITEINKSNFAYNIVINLANRNNIYIYYYYYILVENPLSKLKKNKSKKKHN